MFRLPCFRLPRLHRTARSLGAVLMTLTAASVASTVLATPRAAASTAELPTPVAPVAPVAGVWPLEPRPHVVAGFDPPATRWGSGHRGVDLAGRAGQPVRAALAGTVTFAGRLAGRGVVVVDHGTTRTTYEPVSATVRVGGRVGAGAVLGGLQLFGSHCFPRWCLHWGLIEGRDHYLDPLTLVGAAPVRLLPLWSVLPAIGPLGQSSSLGAPIRLAPVAGPEPQTLLTAPQARGWAWR